MSFSEALRREADSIFDSIYAHPFVQGIADGKLPAASLTHYVQQDTQYLDTYCKVYGMALAKAITRDQMRVFHEHIGVLLDGELAPHKNLCRVAGVKYEDVVRTPADVAPTAHHYARHMLSIAQQGTLGEIIAVLLPCHWVYVDIGQRMMAQRKPTVEHPFYDWISFYASDTMASGLAQLTAIVDELAETSGDLDLYMMKSAFLDSFRLEYQFFDMAYHLERWKPLVAGGDASETGHSGIDGTTPEHTSEAVELAASETVSPATRGNRRD